MAFCTLFIGIDAPVLLNCRHIFDGKRALVQIPGNEKKMTLLQEEGFPDCPLCVRVLSDLVAKTAEVLYYINRSRRNLA